MTDPDTAAVNALAAFLHDDMCNDGDTRSCGRWNSPDHLRHVEYYRDLAVGALEAAAPHITAAATAAERERIITLLHARAPRYALGATALRHIATDLLTEGDTT